MTNGSTASETPSVTPPEAAEAVPVPEAVRVPAVSENGTEDPRNLDGSIARLFASGQTYSQIAETLRISRSTVARRLAAPEVKRRVRVLADMRVNDIVNDLNGASSSAVLVLQRVVMDNAATDAVRVRAADSILQHLGRFTLRSPNDPVTVAEAREALVVRLQEMARRKAEGEPTSVEAYLDQPDDTETQQHPNQREDGPADADQ